MKYASNIAILLIAAGCGSGGQANDAGKLAQVLDAKKAVVDSLVAIDYYRRDQTPTVLSLKPIKGEMRIDGRLYLAHIASGKSLESHEKAIVLFHHAGGPPTILCVIAGDVPTVENLRYIGREYWWDLRMYWIGENKPLTWESVIETIPASAFE